MSENSDRTSSSRTFLDLLRERAEERPDHRLYTFLADGEVEAGSLTHRELDRRARALAAWLQEAGCREERVLLLFPPGLDFIAAFFGCLYAGAVAVPAYPPRPHRADERLAEIVRDARPRAVLTTSALLDRVAAVVGEARRAAVDRIPDELAGAWRAPDLGPDDLAFLQYTSGSTAAPKGVRVTHGNLLDNEEKIRRAFGQSPESVVVGWLPLYHDMGLIGNVLQPLWSGGRCLLMSPQAFLQRPARWLEAIARHRATTSGGPNFAYDLCVRRVGPEQRAALDLSSWQVAFNGAEPVRRATLDRFAEAFGPCGFRRAAFVPCYGLAEATLLVAAGGEKTSDGSDRSDRSVRSPAAEPVSCGAPSGEVVVVSAETGLPCAAGAEGEIWVGGPSVAAGYWNRPAETLETFGARLADGGGPYLRTGDLGFVRDGELFVTGRSKDLIILRGRNHHPQDLELTAERAHPALRPGGCAAFSVDSGAEERLVLAAEIEPRARGGEALAEEVGTEVRRALAAEHEVSVQEVVLLAPGTLPRTSSGKVRRGACRTAWQEGSLAVAGRSVAAGTDPAALVAWLLGAPEAGGEAPGEEIEPDLPLVARGLDSLGAVELVHRIAAATGVELSPAELLGGWSLRELAAEVASRRGAVREVPRPASRRARRSPSDAGAPLSFGQQRLWFQHRMDPLATTDNLTGRYRLHGLVDLPALGRALGEIVRRHEVLRTVYRQAPGADEPVQIVRPPFPVDLPLVDLAGLPAEAVEAEADRLAAAEAERPFDLAEGPVLRAAALRLAPREHRMLTTLHHIACDGWSAGVLLGELGVLYRAFAAGRPSPLPELAYQYVDFAAWQRRQLDGPVLQEQLRFWRERLAGAPPVLELPSDRPRPAVRSARGGRLPVEIPAAVAARLAGLAQREGMTLYAVLLALYQAWLGRLTGVTDLVVGSPVAGRRHAETRGLIGFFVNTVALRADLAGDPSLGEHLARTRRAVLDAFAHQDLPFERLVEDLRPERSLAHAPLFQVLFVFQNTPGGTLALPGLQVEVLAPAPTSHFDLELELAEEGGGLRGALGYALDLFETATAERLVASLEAWLGAAAGSTLEAPLAELSPLTEAERRALKDIARRQPAAPAVEAAAAPVPAEAEAVAGLWAELLGGGRVEVHENVFVRGAHSLLVTRMAWRLREAFGVELPLRVLFEEPTPAGLARRVAAARASAAEEAPLAPRERPDPLPLSFAQQRLWFEDQREPGSALYNMPAFLVLRGPLDAVALEGAFTALVRRHEVLRTTFPDTRGRPRQAIAPPAPFRLPLLDLTALPADRRAAEAWLQGQAEARRPFDLAAGPLLRGFLLRLGAAEHRLVVNMHHIVSDGWSLAILVEEIGAFYGDSAAPRPELPVQYADFTLWQRERHAGGAAAADLTYWRHRLAAAPALELETDRPRPAVRGTRGATVPVEVPEDLAERLEHLGLAVGATPFMVLLAAFHALLHRETGAEDLAVGTPAAGRAHRETEGLIGFFVNTLVIRVDHGGSPSFQELTARVREAVLGAAAHQDLPFERLVEELVPHRDAARTPLVQVLFTLEEREPAVDALAGLEMTSRRLTTGTAKADLSLALARGPQGLAGAIEYATDLFDHTTIQRLARRCERLLAAVAEAPDEPVDALPLLAAAERHQVAVEWAADARAAYPRERSVHELFAEQAARTPDLPALSGGGERLTYAELRHRAGRLARHLVACGVGPEDLVAVLLERSPELIVTFLAILEAGGAYVPLDPAYPVERLAFMLRDSGARVLVAREVPEGLVVPEGVVVKDLKDTNDNNDQGSVSLETLASLESFSSPTALAYALYTSGSTGLPKATGVPHRGVVRLVCGGHHARLGPGDRVAQISSPSFDAATFEIWGALLSGAELVVAPAHRTSLEELGGFLEREAISALCITTSLFHQMVDGPLHQLARVRQVLAGGEVLSPVHVRKLAAAFPGPDHRLFCCYGPTENTTFTSIWPAAAPDGVPAPVPIGRPVANTEVYVIDLLVAAARPAPVGVAGELVTSGDGLARGYLGRPDLTAERFVPDPFGPPGGRLYRTGDRARWRADGTLEFLGRLDGQIKLRGFRIEPGEIEAAAAAFPGVEQAVVLLREDPPGPRLVLVLVSHQERDTAAVRAFLRGRLPEPMIPAAFVWVDALPLTANGKLDRRALLRLEAPAESRPGSHETALPRTPIEEGLAGIWREVLGTAAVGREDDFFELGGHSLLATQVASRVRESFGVELPLRDVFATPRLADLAAHVAEEQRRGAGLAAPPVVPVPRDAFPDGLPLSYSQEWMWVAGQLNPEAAAYNAPIAARLDGALDVAALAAALREVARRHEVLRTRFVTSFDSRTGALQVPDPGLYPPFAVADLAALPAALGARETDRLAREEAARPFDLETGPPARALLVRRGADDHLLLFSPHHLVTDGWSGGVLLREVAALYGGASLPALPVQYGDYAVWQRRWLTGTPLDTLVAWWREHLAGPPPHLELPVDHLIGSKSGATPPGGLGARLPFRPEPAQVEALRALARGRGSTLFAVLLAAWKTLLGRLTRQDDLVVGTPVANRTRRELEGLIGYFVNDVPLRTRLGGDPPFLELLDRVHGTALGAWAHQDLPLQKILREVGDGAPLFRTWFQLQNMRLPGLELPGVQLSLVEVEAPAATFDLELITLEQDGGLTGHLVYHRELFERATAQSLLQSFRVLLAEIAADPARRLSELPLLTLAEQMALVQDSRGGAAACPGETTLHRAFEAVAAAHPKAPAVTCEGESLTYAELNRRADILARRLRAQGLGPEARVGLCLERSLELVIGILGVLKSGAAYVPLDPAYPRERLDLLQEDARLHAVVAREESVFTITKRLPAPPSTGEAGPDHLAYVIYTSGSTGRPKGVMVTHRQAVRLFEATRGFGFGPADVWTLFHSYAFDFSVWEIWGALLHGGRLVVVPHGVSRSPADFLDLLAVEKVTVLNQTPSAFYQLLRAQEEWGDEVPALALRCVIFGGEALEPAKLRPWFERYGDTRPVLVNMYGITETTVHVTERPLTRGDAASPDSVLGRPLADLRLVLLDAALAPVPAGAVGEMCVGGGGVARGYLFRPELTAERFIPDPFGAENGEPGARLYRSGDLARRRADGEVVYLGRADRQLKVRGFRIEPGEVEAALLRHPQIAEAAVFADKRSAEDVRLVACLVCRGAAPAPAELREHLLALLPEAWVPGHFVPVPALPLTAHGKLDREALAALADRADHRSDPSDPSDLTAAPSAPLTPLEEHLATLWADLLGIDRVERDDNFFTLGGHSLLVTWIASRVREAFRIPPPMGTFFERPTVGNLALGVLRELVAKLPPGRSEELLALVEGLPEAEVARRVGERREDLTPRPPLPPLSPRPGEGAPPPENQESPTGGGSPSPGGRESDGRGGQGVRSWSVRDLRALLPPPIPEPPLRVTTLAFPTCNRPAILERGLASHAEAAREHGRTLRFAVLDDSPDPAVGADYRQRLSALRRRLGIEIVYAGPAEKRRFADLLVAEGLPAEAVAAALLDPEGIGLPIGANRNAVLLQTVGEGVVSVDDDTLARGGPPPESEPGIELLTGSVPDWAFLSAREPGLIRGFTRRADAMAAVDLRSVDLAALHEELLGRDVPGWVNGLDPDAPVATGRADAAFLESLAAGGRVRVTTNGWVGDCGWRSPIFYMLQTGASWRHLVRSAEGYRAVTASKEVVRYLPRPAVGNAESFMATMFCGFDHRTLLPPFPPVLWGEDRLYGLTLQLAFPTARAGHLPWVALHDPLEQRSFWPGEMVRSASGIDHSRLLASLLADFVPDPRQEPADGLRRLGAFLQDLGRMEPGAFDELARRKVRDRAEAFAAGLEARLADWREQEASGDRLEGGALWADDVRRYLDLLRRHLADPDFVLPLDLLYHREPAEARSLAQRLFVHHGRTLAVWPDLFDVVRGLKERGRTLAEVVP